MNSGKISFARYTGTLLLIVLLLTAAMIFFEYARDFSISSLNKHPVKNDGHVNDNLENQLQERNAHLEAKLNKILERIEQLSCRSQGIGTRGGFCLTKDNLAVGGNWAWDAKLALEFEKLLENQRVGDLGAGLGWYGRFFLRDTKHHFHTAPALEEQYFFNDTTVMNLIKLRQRVASWKGYDGASFVHEVTGGLVEYLDLSEPVHLPHKFDWVISLEVGEHIPMEFEQIFIDNLARHACKGIIMSWALPDQGGHFHVNNRPQSYIREQMSKRGFQWEEKWTMQFRNISSLYWFQNTLMVYSKKKIDSSCL